MISLTLVFWASAGAAGRATPAIAMAAAPMARDSFDITDVLSTFKRATRSPGSSNALRQADCKPASGANRGRQQRIADCFGGAMFAGRVAMLQFLGAEGGDIGGQLGVAIAELVELAAVMAVDLRLDRVGAGHGRF